MPCVKDAAKKYMEQGMPQEEAYHRANQEYINDKLSKENIGNLTARERYDLEMQRERLLYAQAEQYTGMSRDEVRAKAHVGNETNLQVLAVYEQNGQQYLDVNSTARDNAYKNDALIPGPGGQEGLSNVNNTTNTAHTVFGNPVCGYCKSDTKKMGMASGLDSMTVNESATGKSYTFNSSTNDFYNVSDGGKG